KPFQIMPNRLPAASIEVGSLAFIYPSSLLNAPSMHAELGLTEEQKTRLAALSRVMADRRNNNPAEEAVAGILRPEQLQRLRGLRYQQLENARNIAGAAVLYRYRPFVEGLALSEEQRQRLQQLVNDYTRNPANNFQPPAKER